MNRKQPILGGIVLTALLALCVVLLVTFIRRQSDEPAGTENRRLISELTYCSDDQSKPCVVSFSVDMDGNMLVNILLPNLSYPDYYLKITHNGTNEESKYECLRVSSSPNSSYCIGGMMPPGETLRLMLFATQDETLLAEGDLSIIGLVFPTIAVVSPTPETTLTGTASTPSPTLTETPDFILPTSTPRQFLTPTRTPPAYPNPSYP